MTQELQILQEMDPLLRNWARKAARGYDVEDIHQEMRVAVVGVVRKMGVAGTKPLAMTCAMNRVSNLLRRRRLELRVMIPLDGHDHPDMSGASLEIALTNFQEPDRPLARMIAHGYDPEELAAHYSVSLSAMYKRINKLRQKYNGAAGASVQYDTVPAPANLI